MFLEYELGVFGVGILELNVVVFGIGENLFIVGGECNIEDEVLLKS